MSLNGSVFRMVARSCEGLCLGINRRRKDLYVDFREEGDLRGGGPEYFNSAEASGVFPLRVAEQPPSRSNLAL